MIHEILIVKGLFKILIYTVELSVVDLGNVV